MSGAAARVRMSAAAACQGPLCPGSRDAAAHQIAREGRVNVLCSGLLEVLREQILGRTNVPSLTRCGVEPAGPLLLF